LLQTLQQCEESPVCWRRWLFRCSFLVNVLWQNSHLCGDSPVWMRTWFVKCSLRVNDLEQKWHRCGDSPVCWRTWFVKCSFRVKDLVQYWHLCGDSPVCCLTWFTRWSFRVNAFGQYVQRKGVSPAHFTSEFAMFETKNPSFSLFGIQSKLSCTRRVSLGRNARKKHQVSKLMYVKLKNFIKIIKKQDVSTNFTEYTINCNNFRVKYLFLTIVSILLEIIDRFRR